MIKDNPAMKYETAENQTYQRFANTILASFVLNDKIKNHPNYGELDHNDNTDYIELNKINKKSVMTALQVKEEKVDYIQRMNQIKDLYTTRQNIEQRTLTNQQSNGEPYYTDLKVEYDELADSLTIHKNNQNIILNNQEWLNIQEMIHTVKFRKPYH